MNILSEIIGNWSGADWASVNAANQQASAAQLAALYAQAAHQHRKTDYSLLMNAWPQRRPLLEPEIVARTGTPWMDLA